MFKEEMRLFPMMEQGGNTLIGLLIEDLHREHVAHEKAMNALSSLALRSARRPRPLPTASPIDNRVGHGLSVERRPDDQRHNAERRGGRS